MKEKMSMIEIEKGISIPHCKKYYPFDLMEVGDSFVSDMRAVQDCACLANKRLAPRRFTTRKLSDGTFRCWRYE